MKTPKTQGTYYFKDGYTVWVYGLSAQEKKMMVYEHGAIVRFIPGS